MNKLFLKNIIIIIILICSLTLCGCGSKRKSINSISDLMSSDAVIAYPMGSGVMFQAEKTFKNAQLVSMGDETTSFLALQKGSIDAYCHLRHYLEFYCITQPENDFKILDEYFDAKSAKSCMSWAFSIAVLCINERIMIDVYVAFFILQLSLYC